MTTPHDHFDEYDTQPPDVDPVRRDPSLGIPSSPRRVPLAKEPVSIGGKIVAIGIAFWLLLYLLLIGATVMVHWTLRMLEWYWRITG